MTVNTINHLQFLKDRNQENAGEMGYSWVQMRTPNLVRTRELVLTEVDPDDSTAKIGVSSRTPSMLDLPSLQNFPDHRR
ncbi:hypothetical protein L1887_26242 [Cichorium endivia]|nr:hypothetical protein L1887_26242 [Cichorium endivia]